MFGREGYRDVGPFCLGNTMFGRNMVYFSTRVSALSFGVGFSIGSTNDCKD
jgi:hypothetical protein